MIYLNLTTKAKKKTKARRNYTPRKEKKLFVVVFVWTAGWFLCSSRGFVYLSFFYIFPPSHECSFFCFIFENQIPRIRFITSFDICISALFKKPLSFSDETDIHLFSVFCYLSVFWDFTKKKNNQTYYWSHMPKWINTECAL